VTAREESELYFRPALTARVDARDDVDAEDEDVVTRGNQSDERLTTERRADRMAPRRTARTRSIECSMR